MRQRSAAGGTGAAEEGAPTAVELPPDARSGCNAEAVACMVGVRSAQPQPAAHRDAEVPAAPLVSLRLVYEESCARQGVRPNTKLLQLLPAACGVALQELDLGLNFVGAVGVRAVLDVVRAAHGLERLSLRDNYINNAVASEVVRAVDGHPTLRVLDLSNNPVSVATARQLVPLLHRNPLLRRVELANTLVSPALAEAVRRASEANAAAEAAPGGAAGAAPALGPQRKRRSKLRAHVDAARRGQAPGPTPPPGKAPAGAGAAAEPAGAALVARAAAVPLPPSPRSAAEPASCAFFADEDPLDCEAVDILAAFAADADPEEDLCPSLAVLLGAFD